MDDDLAFGEPDLESGPGDGAVLLPVQVGGATVFVEQVGKPRVETDDEIYAVGPPSPTEAFEKANDALKECVRVVGEALDGIGEHVKPQEISLEFSLSFQAEGSAHIIPVLVTGKTGATTGLKVTATWKPGERPGRA